jgi:predicted nucleic acid-binding protein
METVDDDTLYVSAITVMEARKGFAKERIRTSGTREAEKIHVFEAQFDKLLSAFDDRVLPVDRLIADKWGELLAERNANVLDTAVAATAAIHGMMVATRNLRDFRRRGITLIDPFKMPARLIQPQ